MRRATSPPDWLIDAIITGLKTLLALSSLDRAPGGDMMQHTVLVWAQALHHGRQLVEARDRPRIEEAFTVIAATYRTWPLPIDLIQALPRLKPAAPALLRLTSEESIRSGQAAIADILASLDRRSNGAPIT